MDVAPAQELQGLPQTPTAKEQHKALGKRFPGNGVAEILEEMELLAQSRAVLWWRFVFGWEEEKPL